MVGAVILSRPIEVSMTLRNGRWPSRPEAPMQKAVGKTILKAVRWSCPAQSWKQTFIWLRDGVLALNVVFFVFCAASILSPPASAQTTVNDIHVVPREVEKAKPADVTKQSLVSPTLEPRIRPLKV